MAERFTRPRVRGTALIRRARWLERKIAEGPPDRPGLSYDTAEYAELLWVFESLGVPFTPADADDDSRGAPRARLDECPVRDEREEPPRRYGRERDDDLFVPGEPRRSGYYGRGGL